MMECSVCNQWVHSRCEGLTDEYYEILSALPDSIEYTCCLCSHEDSIDWMSAVRKEYHQHIQSLIEKLQQSGLPKNNHKDNLKCLTAYKRPQTYPTILPPVQMSKTTGLESPLITPKVSKDIDDDCISSDESVYSDSESEIESLPDEDCDPRTFDEILKKFQDGAYKSLLETHVDINRVIARTPFDEPVNAMHFRDLYLTTLKQSFPWFDTEKINIFDTVDRKRVVPVPSLDHNYLLSKDSFRRCHTKYWNLLNRRKERTPRKHSKDTRKCVFCNVNGDSSPNQAGRLIYFAQNEWLHVNCCLWSSEVYENETGGLQNIAIAVTRGKQIKCSWCDERGATVGCCQKSCAVTFHLMCARQTKCLFMKDKQVFCYQHSDDKLDFISDNEFTVSRRIYVNWESERKRWKQVAGADVSVTIGSMTIKQLGTIQAGAETENALIPNDFISSRLYWSTINPVKRVWYTCRVRVVVPENNPIVTPSLEYNDTIDHSLDPAVVQTKLLTMRKWHQKTDQTSPTSPTKNKIVPPHLSALYQKILFEEKHRKAVALRNQPIEEICDDSEPEDQNLMSMILNNLPDSALDLQENFPGDEAFTPNGFGELPVDMDDLDDLFTAPVNEEYITAYNDPENHSNHQTMELVSPEQVNPHAETLLCKTSTQSTPVNERKIQVCKVLPMSFLNKEPSANVANSASEKKRKHLLKMKSRQKKICMKRNYKTVIKNYETRGPIKPIKTVQIEIKETIEMPDQKRRRRQVSSLLKENQAFRSDTAQGTSKVVQISDDMNNITVSIVDTKFPEKKRKPRLRRKTLLQVDGAVDLSSSEDGVSSRNSSLIHHIKQQSLARSAPGNEGPLKCTKCKRSYRTKDSFEKHSETCTFEIDSSTTSDEDSADQESSLSMPDIPDNNNTETHVTIDHQQEHHTDSPTEALVKLTDKLAPIHPQNVKKRLLPHRYPPAKRVTIPRKYSNQRLVAGAKGYPLKRTLQPVPQVTAQLSSTPHSFMQQNANINQQYSVQQANISAMGQPMVMPTRFATPFNDVGINPPQIATVVPGPSVALPQGYTLQYVGSFRGDQMATNSNYMTTYNPIVMPPPMMIAPPPPPPVVVPQVIDTNIAYTITTPNGVLYNPNTSMAVPNVQYIQQPQGLSMQNLVQAQPSPIILQQNTFQTMNSMVTLNAPMQSQPIVSTLHHECVSSATASRPDELATPLAFISPMKPVTEVDDQKPRALLRPLFPNSTTQRSVATVAPAVFTTTVSSANSHSSNNAKPRPTYSYRDAMKGSVLEKPEEMSPAAPDEPLVPANAPKISADVQSFKIRVKKNDDTYDVEPLTSSNIVLNSPEIKEVRIKAKVSIGPKRKKQHVNMHGRTTFVADKDISKDPYANEIQPNLSLNLSVSKTYDDEIRQKKGQHTKEPEIVFELTSEDGFKVESKYISEVWQKVFDAVAQAREVVKIGNQPYPKGDTLSKGNLSGFHMLGLTNNAVQYLLEQLPESKRCHKYSFKFQTQPEQQKPTGVNRTGCLRTETFKKRSPYDIFSWLASKHRKIPQKTKSLQDECLPLARRPTSLELPMAMRYRHLCETAREAVGVFRSEIHGRGLFCKRDIEAGEMVIEYAGQVIRSSLCDIREQAYESKGIGCYMFRIDNKTVVDATLNGNAARFINHSCDPNCFSRVVDILSKKHILIFALRKISQTEELTYDYKFPIEEDKIPCSCGTKRCRKYLN